MAYSTDARNSMLDHLATEAAFASLHTGDPAGTGANEIAGGSPAYARQAITWSAAASGTMDASNVPVFNVPPSTEVQYVGLWTLEEGGTFVGSDEVTHEAFAAQGTYTLADMDLDLNLVS